MNKTNNIQLKLCIPILLILFNMFIHKIDAQEIHTLDKMIQIGTTSSNEIKKISLETKALDLDIAIFSSSLGYKLDLFGQLPRYTNSNYSIIQNDGNIAFQSINYNNSMIGVSLSKKIWQTGGQLQISSELQRFDNFNNNTHTYNGIPVRISFQQNIFGYNPYKWKRKNNTVKKQIISIESKSKEVNLIQRINNAYFNILQAQSAMESNLSNKQLSETLLDIAMTKDSLGVLSKKQLLQLQLQQKNASSQYNIASTNFKTAIASIKVLISTNNTMDGVFEIPTPISIKLNIASIIEKAAQNSAELLKYKSQMEEKEQFVKEQSKKFGPYLQFNASLGLIRSDAKIQPIYNDAKRDQSLSLSFNIPILDSNTKKNQVALAQLELNMEMNSILQRKMDFNNDIQNIVLELKACQDRLKYAKEIRTMALENLKINTQVFKLGAISITELNYAIREKDQALNYYLNEVQTYWNLYYQLQFWTLYDYKNQINL